MATEGSGATVSSLGLLGTLIGEGSGNLGHDVIAALPIVGPILEGSGALSHFAGSGITKKRLGRALNVVNASPVLAGVRQFATATGLEGLDLANAIARESPSTVQQVVDTLGTLTTANAAELLPNILDLIGFRRETPLQVIAGTLAPGQYSLPGTPELPRTYGSPSPPVVGAVPGAPAFPAAPPGGSPGLPQPPPGGHLTWSQRLQLLLVALLRSGLLQQLLGRRPSRPAVPVPYTFQFQLPAGGIPPSGGGGGGGSVPFIDTSLPIAFGGNGGAVDPWSQLIGVGSQLIGQLIGGGNGGGMAYAPGGALLPSFDIPGMDITAQGTSALTSPWRSSPAGSRAQRFVTPNPSSGRLTWFGPIGRPLLFSGDLSACKRVRKVAGRAARYSPRRRARRGRR